MKVFWRGHGYVKSESSDVSSYAAIGYRADKQNMLHPIVWIDKFGGTFWGEPTYYVKFGETNNSQRTKFTFLSEAKKFAEAQLAGD